MEGGQMTNGAVKMKDRIRLAEFSLLLAVLNVDPEDYLFLSREPQPGHNTDVEAIRSEISRTGNREESVATVYLPSFKNYFPETFMTENLEESDHYPGYYDDRNMRFWSAFDTITYRFWIEFHIHKLRMLLYVPDIDTELLYWSRFGGDTPSLGSEARKYLLLFRFFAPFFRGRRLLYERVLPAFIKKRVTVHENVPQQSEVPSGFRSRLGKRNSSLGRDLFPGRYFIENHSGFRVRIEGLEIENIAAFRPGGTTRELLDNLLQLFAPAHLRANTSFSFKAGLRTFILGCEDNISYLGFSTYLRETG
jgi:hypothetical protein